MPSVAPETRTWAVLVGCPGRGGNDGSAIAFESAPVVIGEIVTPRWVRVAEMAAVGENGRCGDKVPRPRRK